MVDLSDLRNDLNRLKNPKKAKVLQGFFKTGKGEYGEGDIFLGLTVPQSRSIAQKYSSLPFGEIKKLLQSKIHEERLIALLILVYNFQHGNNIDKEKIYKYYLLHTKFINNWDLVDLSADKIVGQYLFDKPRDILVSLARSHLVWEKRTAIIATYQFIKNQDAKDALRIAQILLQDKHDLIQKAVGWMLREVGKRCSEQELKKFLQKNYKVMPRTMLRYAIEHFPENVRKSYLNGSI